MITNFANNPLSFFDKVNLEFQRVASRLLFVITGPLMNYMVFGKFKLRFEDIKEVRSTYRKMLSEGKGPILLCSNHLTYVDSVIQSVFLASIIGHLFKFSQLAWHLPEKSNFAHNFKWRTLCYLGKCIPVIRSGSREETKRVMQKMLYVLDRGDVISIFPEGTRSRSGLIDDENFSYGVGQILKHYDHSRILCIYMRDKNDGGFAKFPKKDADYYFKLEMFNPTSELKGNRKAKDLSTQVVKKLKEMEDQFFLAH